MQANLVDVIDNCIDKLQSGESIEDCLQANPGFREELLPTLQSMVLVMQAACATTVSSEAKTKGLEMLRTVLKAKRGNKSWFSRKLDQLYSSPGRLVTAGFVGILASMIFAGTTSASSNALPGDSLYWLKIARENISLMIPKSDLEKARNHITLAAVRGEEVGGLIGKGRLEEANRATARINHHINKSAWVMGVTIFQKNIEMPYNSTLLINLADASDLKQALGGHRERLRNKFVGIEQEHPVEIRQRIVIIRAKTELGFRALIAALDRIEVTAYPVFRKTDRLDKKCLRYRCKRGL